MAATPPNSRRARYASRPCSCNQTGHERAQAHAAVRPSRQAAALQWPAAASGRRLRPQPPAAPYLGHALLRWQEVQQRQKGAHQLRGEARGRRCWRARCLQQRGNKALTLGLPFYAGLTGLLQLHASCCRGRRCTFLLRAPPLGSGLLRRRLARLPCRIGGLVTALVAATLPRRSAGQRIAHQASQAAVVLPVHARLQRRGLQGGAGVELVGADMPAARTWGRGDGAEHACQPPAARQCRQLTMPWRPWGSRLKM